MTGTSDRQAFSERVAAEMFARDRTAQSLAICIEAVRPGHARVSMRVRDDMLNAHDICHGGFVFLLADCAFAYACNAENRSTLALACTINFAATARRGEQLIAVGDASARAGRTGVYDVTVTAAGDGRTIALFRGHSYRIEGETIPGLGDPPEGVVSPVLTASSS